MASSLREIEELAGYTQENPMPAGADIITQQEAVEALNQRAESARVAGTVTPFESSFNPTNSNFRQTIKSSLNNLFGGSNISSNPNYLQGRIANTLSGLVDFAPVVGDAVGVGDTITSYRQGDMLGTGINALATGVGVLPLVGGPASKAVKAGANRVRSALRDIGYGDDTFYHASKQDIRDEFKAGYNDDMMFITPSPEFANQWLGKGKYQTRIGDENITDNMWKADRQKLWDEYESKYGNYEQWPQEITDEYFTKNSSLSKQYDSADSVVYPVTTKAKNPFIPDENPEILREYLESKGMNPDSTTLETGKTDLDVYLNGNYLLYENKEMADFLNEKGFDSAWLKESTWQKDSPYTTLAVFDPKSVRSIYDDPSSSVALGETPSVRDGGRSALNELSGDIPVEQRLKTAREKYESSPNDKVLREDYLNIRRERDALGGSVDQAAPEVQPILKDYRGSHQPPDREYGASLDNLTDMIPEDVYSASGPRLYGLGDPAVDREAFASLNKARGNPRQEVAVYRAVPLDVDNINAGDWVTTSRRYAEMHGDNALGGDYKILEQKARAGDLQSEGYPYEFGFNPLDLSGEARMTRAQDLGFDTNRTAYRGIYGEYDPDKAGHYQMFTSSPEDAGEYGNSVISTYLKRGKNLVVDGGRNNFNSIPISQLPDEVRANLHSTLTDVARTDDIAHAAQAAGYDSVSINNVFDKASNEIPMKPAPKANEPMSQEMIDILNEVEQSGMYPGADFSIAPEIPKNYDPVTVDIIFDPKNIRSTNAEFDPTRADSADLLSSISPTQSSLRNIA